jgi:hypothetical protein
MPPSAADDDGDLHAHLSHVPEFRCDARQGGGIDAVVHLSQKRLAAQLEKDPLRNPGFPVHVSHLIAWLKKNPAAEAGLLKASVP